MKMTNRILILLLIMFNSVMVFSQTNATPPAPTGKGAAVAAGPSTPTPPDVPIDGGLFFVLVLAGFLLGVYVINKNGLYKKASV